MGKVGRQSSSSTMGAASFLIYFIITSIAVVLLPPLLSQLLERQAVYGLERNTTQVDADAPIANEFYQRTTVHFDSHGTRMEGWLYLPHGSEHSFLTAIQPPPGHAPDSALPVVLMAHGFGTQKDDGLHLYAERFVMAGLAALVFDYRCFGGSDGMPRNWVDWKRHVEDWESAVEFAKSGGLGSRVDGSKVALWGVSYAGGHVLMTAAHKGEDVAAVVSNEPFLTGKGRLAASIEQRGLLMVARLFSLALLDQMRAMLGLPAVYVKIVGAPSELALLEMEPKELQLVRGRQNRPRIGGWRPICPARMVLTSAGYNPIDHLHKVKVPVLIRAGTYDATCPIQYIHQAVEILGERATLIEEPYAHVEMHRRSSEPEEIRPVIAFLKQHLGMAEEAAAAAAEPQAAGAVPEGAEQREALAELEAAAELDSPL